MNHLTLCSIALLLVVLFSSCDKNADQPTCNCSGQYYKFRAGGTTLSFPTAFTPNGDGRNDYFRPVHRNVISNGYFLQISNSRKQVVYTTTDLNGYWDGLENGQRAPQGRYEVLFRFSDQGGTQIESCTCFSVLEYEQIANCLRVSPGAFAFEDQFNLSTGDPDYQTTEFLCP